jgi:methanogenic corrinoid protein MtbC1
LLALLGRPTEAAEGALAPVGPVGGADPGDRAFCAQALDAVKRLDTHGLDEALQRAQVSLGDQGLLRRVITPLARELGLLWKAGRITAAQEHFFTAMAKMFIWTLTRQYRPDKRAPTMVVATPAGQYHEIGARIVAAVASSNGWNVTYLGASLPAFEIAGAVQTCGATALALSIVFPEDDPQLAAEITQLGQLLPQKVRLLVGGRASAAYLPALERIGARLLATLDELDAELTTLRRREGTR